MIKEKAFRIKSLNGQQFQPKIKITIKNGQQSLKHRIAKYFFRKKMKTNYHTIVILLTLILPLILRGQEDYKLALKSSKELGFFERMEYMEGKKLFDFEEETYEGEKITSSTIKGKVAIINFWFMSCPPCIAELGGLNEIVEKYEGKEVKFISFTLDTKEILSEDFFPNYEFKFEIIPNAESLIFEELNHPFGFPTTMVVDKEGRIRKLISGGSTEEEEATAQIKSLLIPLIEECLSEK